MKIDLSGTKKYNIAVRGISDSVFVFDKKYTDTLIVFAVNIIDKPAIKIDLDLLATYNGGNYYAGEFGFDVNTPVQVKNAKADYRNHPADAYMSFIAGQPPAKMQMEVTAGSFPKDYEMEIKAAGLTVFPNKFTAKELEKAVKEKIKFTITPKSAVTDDKLQVIGRSGSTEEILYEINYSVKNAKDLVKRKLMLLYVVAEDKDLGKNIDKAYENDVAKQLNNYSYNQAFTEWDVKAEVVDIRDILSKSLQMQKVRESFDSLSNQKHQTEMLKFIEKYGYTKDQKGYDEFILNYSSKNPIFSLASKITSTDVHTGIMHDLFEIYTNQYENSYLAFIFDRSSFSNKPAAVPGAAADPKDDHGSVFLFSKVRDNLSVFTHELGHSLGLKHPFEEFGTPYANTFNYMDYKPNANMFWYWQWDFIRTTQKSMIINAQLEK